MNIGRPHSKSFTQTNTNKRMDLSTDKMISHQSISDIEKQRLESVYNHINSVQIPLQKIEIDGITSPKLMIILENLKYKVSKHEADLFIWEVDDDEDGVITRKEFEMMYKRCIFDVTYLEPRNLFNLVQFLMYDKQHKGRITEEDTLEIIFVRVGKANLSTEIDAIFGNTYQVELKQPVITNDGWSTFEKSISFEEFFLKMKKRDFCKRIEPERERQKKLRSQLPSVDDRK
ncbi:hypothetical protein pb186bvf_008358 [Paramecium bursaria]